MMRKQMVSLALGSGQDLRRATQTGLAPSLRSATNMTKTKADAWSKRYGFTTMTATEDTRSSGNGINNEVRLLAARGTKLVKQTTGRVLEYNASISRWEERSGAARYPLLHNILAIPGSTHPLTGDAPMHADFHETAIAGANGINHQISVWLNATTRTGYAIVYEEGGGSPIYSPASAIPYSFGGCDQIRVVATPGKFTVFTVQNGGANSTLSAVNWDVATRTFGGGGTVSTALLGTGTGTPYFDVLKRESNNRILVGFRATGPNVRALEWDPVTSTATIASVVVVAGDMAEKGLAWCQVFSGVTNVRMVTAKNDAINGVSARVLNTTTLVQTAATLIKASPGDVQSIAAFYSASGLYDFAVWQVPGATYDTAVHYGYSSPVSTDIYCHTGCLASRFLLDNTTTERYLMLSSPWSGQGGYFFMRDDGGGFGVPTGLQARILRGQGPAAPSMRNALGTFSIDSNSRIVFGALKTRDAFITAGGTSLVFRPVVAVIDPFWTPPPPATVGDTLIFAGSLPSELDANSFAEAGFSLDPEQPTCTILAGAGLGTGNYKYVAVFNYVDGDGRVWMSAQSVASATATTTAGNNQIRVRIKQPAIIDRFEGTGSVGQGALFVELYRTAVGGSVFYRLPIVGGLRINDAIPQQYIDYTDTFADSLVIQGKQLYSGGGELINQPPPPFVQCVTQGARIVGIDAEDRRRVVASKEFQPGQGVGWHPDLTQRIDGDGDNTALAAFDGRVIVFKRQAIYALTGDWPDANGTGALPRSERVCIGYGTTVPRSVVVANDGVWFTDPQKGICRLGHDLQVAQIGAIISSEGLETLAAVVSEDKEEIRFVHGTVQSIWNTVDQQWNQWSVTNGSTAQTACVAGGIYYVGRAIGSVLKYDSSAWTDDASQFTATLAIRLSLARPGGIQRIYRILVSGDTDGDCTINATLSHDYGTVVETTKSIAVTAGSTYEIELRPSNPRDTTVGLTLSFTSATAGAKFSVVAVEVGVDPRHLHRLAPSKIA